MKKKVSPHIFCFTKKRARFQKKMDAQVLKELDKNKIQHTDPIILNLKKQFRESIRHAKYIKELQQQACKQSANNTTKITQK